jgi:hypothetical protein
MAQTAVRTLLDDGTTAAIATEDTLSGVLSSLAGGLGTVTLAADKGGGATTASTLRVVMATDSPAGEMTLAADFGAGAAGVSTLRVVAASDSPGAKDTTLSTTNVTLATTNSSLATLATYATLSSFRSEAAKETTLSTTNTTLATTNSSLVVTNSSLATLATNATLSTANTKLDTLSTSLSSNLVALNLRAADTTLSTTNVTLSTVNTNLSTTNANLSTLNTRATAELAKEATLSTTNTNLSTLNTRATGALALDATLSSANVLLTEIQARVGDETTPSTGTMNKQLADILTALQAANGNGRTFATVAVTQGAAGYLKLGRTASKTTALHAMVVAADTAATTITIIDNDADDATTPTNLTGAIPVPQYGGFVLPFNADVRGCLVTASGNYLGLVSATGKVFGYAVVSTSA